MKEKIEKLTKITVATTAGLTGATVVTNVANVHADEVKEQVVDTKSQAKMEDDIVLNSNSSTTAPSETSQATTVEEAANTSEVSTPTEAPAPKQTEETVVQNNETASQTVPAEKANEATPAPASETATTPSPADTKVKEETPASVAPDKPVTKEPVEIVEKRPSEIHYKVSYVDKANGQVVYEEKKTKAIADSEETTKIREFGAALANAKELEHYYVPNGENIIQEVDAKRGDHPEFKYLVERFEKEEEKQLVQLRKAVLKYTVTYRDKQTGLEVWQEERTYTEETVQPKLRRQVTVTPNLSKISKLKGYKLQDSSSKTLELVEGSKNLVTFEVSGESRRRNERSYSNERWEEPTYNLRKEGNSIHLEIERKYRYNLNSGASGVSTVVSVNSDREGSIQGDRFSEPTLGASGTIVTRTTWSYTFTPPKGKRLKEVKEVYSSGSNTVHMRIW